MRFARWTFGLAAIWGIIVVGPLYFLEAQIAEIAPPAITHPEYYYGFIGAVLAWQLVYALIATDPMRYRPIMLIGALGKLAFFAACLVLYLQGRAEAFLPLATAPDLLLAILFCVAWARLGGQAID
jgi:hypothetical protein